ncbi:hypothetical protein [Solimonas soli]|uniref:hypothetical protein n=1 Tax=Solimonas soli TaxID=413479 RepID=UPI0004B2AA25|nr:hypothetical protein [Solimonas soli]
MSLQSITASVAASRPHGVRRFTAPLVVALAAVALCDIAAAPGLRAAAAAYGAAH